MNLKDVLIYSKAHTRCGLYHFINKLLSINQYCIEAFGTISKETIECRIFFSLLFLLSIYPNIEEIRFC